jgi:GAF domain-containing protein
MPVDMPRDRPALYRDLSGQLAALLAGETDLIANAANMAALTYHGLPDLNWAGFYFARAANGSLTLPDPRPRTGEGREDDGGRPELVLGPFQGKPACVRIAWGRGVCGTAAARGTSVLVPDVHEFPGHIACDAASRSELVVPLVAGGRVVGVFDLDSPNVARFDDCDRAGIERLVAILLDAHPDWP